MQKDSSLLGMLTGNTGASTDAFKAKSANSRKNSNDAGDAALFKNAFAKAVDKLEPKRLPEKPKPVEAMKDKPVAKPEEKIDVSANEKTEVDSSVESHTCDNHDAENNKSDNRSEVDASETASDNRVVEPEKNLDKPVAPVSNEGFKQAATDLQAIIAAQISAIVAKQNTETLSANNINDIAISENLGDGKLGAALLAALSGSKDDSFKNEFNKQADLDSANVNEQLLIGEIMNAFKLQSANVDTASVADKSAVKTNIMQALDNVKQVSSADISQLIDGIKEQISAAPSDMKSSEFAEIIARAMKNFGEQKPEIKTSLSAAGTAIVEQLKAQIQSSAPKINTATAETITSDISAAPVAMKTTGNSASQNNTEDAPSDKGDDSDILSFASIDKDSTITGKTGDDKIVSGVITAGNKGVEKSGVSVSTPAPHEEKKVVEQVVVKIHNAAKDGVQKLSMRLNPPELGQIHVQLDIASDGKTSLTLSADTKETLALMQRNAKELERGLLDTGMKTDAGSLSFNLRGDGEQRQFFGWAGDGANDNNPRAYAYGESLDSEAAPEVGVTKRVVYLSNDEINIII